MNRPQLSCMGVIPDRLFLYDPSLQKYILYSRLHVGHKISLGTISCPNKPPINYNSVPWLLDVGPNSCRLMSLDSRGVIFWSSAAAGLSTLQARQYAQGTTTPKPQAKNVLVLFEQGGMSQMDTWDPKPAAMVDHRTPFRSISTSVAGTHFSELLSKTAQHADKLTVIRCMNQPTPGIGASHPEGAQYIYSGESPNSAFEMPDMGSIIFLSARERKPVHLPPNIMVPGTSEMQSETRIGFLPPRYKVFKTGGNLANPNWHVPDLRLLGIDEQRFQDRTDLLKTLDVGILDTSFVPQVPSMRDFASTGDRHTHQPSDPPGI